VLVTEPLTAENLETIAPLYEGFRREARAGYGWFLTAVDFTGLASAILTGMLQGYVLKDVVIGQSVGFLLYHIEPFEALEIKLIYLAEGVSVKIALDTVIPRFIEDIKLKPGWEVLSYPILGEKQLPYMQYLTWYGFKPVGQSVVHFNMLDNLSVEILQQVSAKPLPEGYRIVDWSDAYQEDVISVLTESFADSVDALWDPRFRSREGIAQALSFLRAGGYGVFKPSCNSIVLNPENKPVGVCLLSLISPDEANIPLIGLYKSERHRKLGTLLLAQTVKKCVLEVAAGKITTPVVSATVATANVSAIRMYRQVGFLEQNWYPHVYQPKTNVLQRKEGVRC